MLNPDIIENDGDNYLSQIVLITGTETTKELGIILGFF